MRLFRKLFAPSDPVTEFWDWFHDRSPELLKLVQADSALGQTLSRQLKAIDARLGFEFGPVQNPRDFTVTACGISEVFPSVERVIQAAPEMPDWRIFAYRQRGTIEGVVLQFDSMRFGDEDIWFSAAPAGPTLDVELYVRGLPSERRGAVQEAVYILLDNALGEYDTVTRIRSIEWYPLPSGPELLGLRPLRDLPSVVDSIKSS